MKMIVSQSLSYCRPILYPQGPKIYTSNHLLQPLFPDCDFFVFLEQKFLLSHKSNIKDYIIDQFFPNCSGSIAGFVVDLSTTPMIDVANELGLPSYLFYTSSAACLRFTLYVVTRHDQVGRAFRTSDEFTRRLKEAKAIIVNSFEELESQAVKSLLELDIPPFYLVGPDEEQVVEIAKGLEQCGHRFLWSLRIQSNCTNLEQILPEVLLKRTQGRGLVCGWVPQIEVLAHKSIGGFVSHCGWNSILESIWYGVPILTWPMHSEQQLNAFEMVKDLGLAVKMRLDYKQGESDMANNDGDSEVQKRVNKMSQVSREAVSKNTNSTSFTWYARLIDLFMMGNADSKS
ncbi:hypothetical protein PTKIN_Ptkin15bG0168900 [Pterospermum kingtungense]